MKQRCENMCVFLLLFLLYCLYPRYSTRNQSIENSDELEEFVARSTPLTRSKIAVFLYSRIRFKSQLSLKIKNQCKFKQFVHLFLQVSLKNSKKSHYKFSLNKKLFNFANVQLGEEKYVFREMFSLALKAPSFLRRVSNVI